MGRRDGRAAVDTRLRVGSSRPVEVTGSTMMDILSISVLPNTFLGS